MTASSEPLNHERAAGNPVDLAAKLATFSEHWSPKIVARYNDNDVMVVKVRGAFVWHSHPDTDDLFLVLAGRITIRLRERDLSGSNAKS